MVTKYCQMSLSSGSCFLVSQIVKFEEIYSLWPFTKASTSSIITSATMNPLESLFHHDNATTRLNFLQSYKVREKRIWESELEISPLHGISTLSNANARWEGLRGQMILRAMPAVALATGRVTLAGQVEGDGPDERGYPGPPGWGLGVRLTTSPRKKSIVMKPYNKPRNVMNTQRRQRTMDLTFGTWNDGWMTCPRTWERWE